MIFYLFAVFEYLLTVQICYIVKSNMFLLYLNFGSYFSDCCSSRLSQSTYFEKLIRTRHGCFCFCLYKSLHSYRKKHSNTRKMKQNSEYNKKISSRKPNEHFATFWLKERNISKWNNKFTIKFKYESFITNPTWNVSMFVFMNGSKLFFSLALYFTCCFLRN